MFKKLIAALSASAFLVACGGGGDAEAPAAGPSAAGFWSSPATTTATAGAMLVTKGGEVWSVDFTQPSYTLYKGTLSTSGDKFSANITAYLGAQSASGTASGSFAEKKTITGVATSGTLSSKFSFSYDTAYETAPSLARIAGTYTPSSGGTVTISASGAFGALAPSGCTSTGTISPSTDGGNYYRISVQAGPAPCATPGLTATGVVGQSGTSLVGGVVAGNLGDAFVLTKR